MKNKNPLNVQGKSSGYVVAMLLLVMGEKGYCTASIMWTWRVGWNEETIGISEGLQKRERPRAAL